MAASTLKGLQHHGLRYDKSCVSYQNLYLHIVLLDAHWCFCSNMWKLHHGCFWDCSYCLCIVGVKLLMHWMRGCVRSPCCSERHLFRWFRLFELLQQFQVWMDDCFKLCTWWQSPVDNAIYQFQHSAAEWRSSRARMCRYLLLAVPAACWAVWHLSHHKGHGISYGLHEGDFHVGWQHHLRRIHCIVELCKPYHVFGFCSSQNYICMLTSLLNLKYSFWQPVGGRLYMYWVQKALRATQRSERHILWWVWLLKLPKQCELRVDDSSVWCWQCHHQVLCIQHAAS